MGCIRRRSNFPWSGSGRPANGHSIVTHSPALADRLRPEELVVCERADDGSSLIPALTTDRVQEIEQASEGMPLRGAVVLRCAGR